MFYVCRRASCCLLFAACCLVFLSVSSLPAHRSFGHQFNWNAHVINSEAVLPAIVPHCVFECLPFAPTPIFQLQTPEAASSGRKNERGRETERESGRERTKTQPNFAQALNFLVKLLLLHRNRLLLILMYGSRRQTVHAAYRAGNSWWVREEEFEKGEGVEGALCMLRDVDRRPAHERVQCDVNATS